MSFPRTAARLRRNPPVPRPGERFSVVSHYTDIAGMGLYNSEMVLTLQVNEDGSATLIHGGGLDPHPSNTLAAATVKRLFAQGHSGGLNHNCGLTEPKVLHGNPSGGRPSRTPSDGPRPQMKRHAAVREQMADLASPGLPSNGSLPQPLKVVLGPKSYSGPELTRAGERAFEEMTITKYSSWKTPRHLPALVWLAENRPHFFVDAPRVIPVPGGEYEIREYDGWESLHTPESVKYIRIPRSNPKRRA